jgi:hypothetical protein
MTTLFAAIAGALALTAPAAYARHAPDEGARPGGVGSAEAWVQTDQFDRLGPKGLTPRAGYRGSSGPVAGLEFVRPTDPAAPEATIRVVRVDPGFEWRAAALGALAAALLVTAAAVLLETLGTRGRAA